MGFRFSKRIRIGKGQTINFGRRGVSFSSKIAKGLSINVGRHGTRTTASIPGTGISYTKYRRHSPGRQRVSRFLNLLFWVVIGILGIWALVS